MSDFWASDPVVPQGARFWENDLVAKDQPITTSNVVRSAASGVPVAGGLLNKLEAATNATLAPALNRFFEPKDQLTEPNWADRYQHSLADQNNMDQAFEQQHPIVDTAAKIAGGTAAFAPIASTAIGARALGLAGDSLPAQIAAGTASGAGIDAADALTRGEDPLTGAASGALFGGAGPVVGRGIGKVVEGAQSLMGNKPPALPTSDALKDAYRAAINHPEVQAVQIKPEAVSDLATKMENDLLKQGFRARPGQGGPVFDTIDELKNAPGPVSVQDIDSVRKALGQVGKGIPTPDSAAARAVTAHLDDFLPNLRPSDVLAGDATKAASIMDEARGNYAAAKRSDTLQGKIDAAELQAASANSGANLENALRQRVKDILNSPKLRAGFSDEEKLMMQRIVRGSAPANIIRAVGNLLGGGGGLGAIVTGGAGMMATGSPAAFIAPLAGAAVKKIGNRMTEAQLAKLDEMIRLRAPASEAANMVRQSLAARRARAITNAGRVGMLAGPAIAPAFSGQNAQ